MRQTGRTRIGQFAVRCRASYQRRPASAGFAWRMETMLSRRRISSRRKSGRAAGTVRSLGKWTPECLAFCGTWQSAGKLRGKFTASAGGDVYSWTPGHPRCALPRNRLTQSAIRACDRGRKYKQERIVVASDGLRDKKPVKAWCLPGNLNSEGKPTCIAAPTY
jgi:hypothetical protein